MADITVTPANVEETTQAKGSPYESGALIVPGEWCYLDTSADNVAKLAKADAQVTAVVKGMALNEVVNIGQPVNLALTGATIDMNASLVGVARSYILSQANAGKMAPVADAADYITFLGWSITTSQFYININVTNLDWT